MAYVADDELTAQAENARKCTPDLVGKTAIVWTKPDAGLTSIARLSIDPPPRRVELNREAYLPAA